MADWITEILAAVAALNPPRELPPLEEEDEEVAPLPEYPTLDDCQGGMNARYNGPCSWELSQLKAASYDNSKIQWVERLSDVVATFSTSNGPYPSEYDAARSVPFALRVTATVDTTRTNNNWIGYYISTGNAVLIHINRAIKVGRYQQLCSTSIPRPVRFLVTKDPDVVYKYCSPGGGYAILGIYWPLYKEAQKRTPGGFYSLGAFTVPQLPNITAIPVPRLPSWFGTVPMPKIMQPWVAMVIPGYTKPTEQEVRLAKSNLTTGSVARDLGIGTILIATLALGGIAYIIWTAKN